MYKILFFLCLQASICTAQNYYVDGTNGNNNNAGTTLALAWRTIQKACNSATPGSTVLIRGGTYTEQLWVNVSGTAGNPITFTPYNNEFVTIDGGSTGNYTELFVIDNQQYITLDGLIFANAIGNFSKGVIIQNGASHIQILNNKIHDIHFSLNPNASVNSSTNVNPFIVYNQNATNACTDIVVSGNEIYNCRTGFSEACTFNGNVDGFVASDNLIHDITNIGIDAAGGYGVCSDPTKDFARNGHIFGNTAWNCVSAIAVSAGIYVDGGRQILIERNTAYDNGRGFEVGCEQPGHTTMGIVVRDNVAYHNREAGLGIGGYDYPNTGKVTNSQIYNNTLYDNVFTNNGDGELLVEYTENCTIQQNLFFATNTAKKLIVTRLNSTGLTMDYNLYYHAAGSSQAVVDWNGTVYTGYAAYQAGVAGSNIDVNSPFTNPLLVNPNTPNFNLQSTSPAIQAGQPGFVPATGETDYYGNVRLVNSRIDIGASESQVPLSSTLLSFDVQQKTYSVQLAWQVATTEDLYATNVERSRDGVYFETIGSVRAKTALGVTNQVYEDTDLEAGTYYYRLLFTDRDDSYYYSPIRSVVLNVDTDVRVWPNPAKNILSIQTALRYNQLRFYAPSGQIVHTSAFEPGRPVELPDLPDGIYCLVLEDSDGRIAPWKGMVVLLH